MGRSSKKGQKVEEPSMPPVILRWQDLRLSDLHENELIMMAPEDYTPPRGKGKGEGKGKGKGKGKGDGKAQVSDDKAKGPPLVNYILMSEYLMDCKMCRPNPDWHRTFQCPNLTPELKEMLKEDRSKFGTCRPLRPEDMGCHICLKRDHWPISCPYQLVYPPGAPVGPFAEIVCLCCGEEKPHPGEPGVDWKARAILKISPTYPSFDSYAAVGAADGASV